MKLRKVKPERFTGLQASEGEYPRLTLTLRDLPEAKQWEVGKPYRLAVDVQQESLVLNESTDGGGRVGFKVTAVGVLEHDAAPAPAAKASKPSKPAIAAMPHGKRNTMSSDGGYLVKNSVH